jgi:hypothetical protein
MTIARHRYGYVQGVASNVPPKGANCLLSLSLSKRPPATANRESIALVYGSMEWVNIQVSVLIFLSVLESTFENVNEDFQLLNQGSRKVILNASRSGSEGLTTVIILNPELAPERKEQPMDRLCEWDTRKWFLLDSLFSSVSILSLFSSLFVVESLLFTLFYPSQFLYFFYIPFCLAFESALCSHLTGAS